MFYSKKKSKNIEECPSPSISEIERKTVCDLTMKAFKKVGYKSLGTVEFLFSNGQFFLLK